MAAPEFSQASGTTFRILRNCRLSWKFWDNEFVVYNPVTGSTHLFDYFSGEVLKRLEARPASRSDLVSRLSQELEIEPEDKLNERIGDLLLRFFELNLIEPL
jgi:PqqD family protein of HPr-rel-A system